MIKLFKRALMKEPYHDIIECLVAALEARDLYTSGHSSRVADMTLDIVKSLGIKGKQRDNIHLAAHLHDIGKIGVPDNVLNKKGKLLPHEYAQIQLHPSVGYKIISKSEGLREIGEIVLSHHERWDGKGYPQGLKEEKIPLGSRIIAVCDSIDAMMSHRSYRKAMEWEQCIEEIRLNKAMQFDPVVVEMAEQLFNKWKKTIVFNKQI